MDTVPLTNNLFSAAARRRKKIVCERFVGTNEIALLT